MTNQRPYNVALLDKFATANIKELDYVNEARNQNFSEVLTATTVPGITGKSHQVNLPGQDTQTIVSTLNDKNLYFHLMWSHLQKPTLHTISMYCFLFRDQHLILA